MSTTFKVVLDKRRANTNGTYPIKLRIIQDGDYKDFSPKVSISDESWDEENQKVIETHQESKSINSTLDRHKARLKRILQLSELEERPDPQLDEIISILKRQGEEVKKPVKHSIIKYAYELADKMKKTGQVGNSIVYNTATNKLKGFVKTEAFTFSELTYKVLDDWNVSMLAEKLEVNTISNYLRTIRAIYNKAIKEGLANASEYPYSRFNIKNEKTKSRSLTREEIKLIAELIPFKLYLIPYQQLFLLSFCLIGINFADLLTLKRSDISEGRAGFRRKKTHKLYSIRIYPKAAELIALLGSGHDGEHLLPFIPIGLNPVELKRQIQLCEHRVNDGLKKIASECGINKEISTYYARYTWANIAKKNCGFTKDMIAEALGHEYGNKVTGIYMDDYSSDVIDDINEKVIAAVFGDGKG